MIQHASPLILPVESKYPSWGMNCFIADNATLVGDVQLGDHCSVWFTSVIRGDVNTIKIGDFCNIQDGAIIHATYQKASTTIGNFVSVGHRAIIHGCTLKDYILVGMGAIIMDHVIVEDYVIVAAGAVVLENTVLESGYIYAGMPAKKLKPITDEQKQWLEKLPHNYVMYADWFM